MDRAEDVVMWRPDSNRETHMDNFRNRINHKYGLKLDTYSELHAWSVEEYPTFWEEVWQYCEVVHSQPYTHSVDRNVRMDRVPTWFPGARLNFAENLLRFRDNRPAVYFAAEGRSGVSQLTFSELHEYVSRVTASMRSCGVEKGDRVAGYLPNCPDTLVAMLATAAIGAVWTCTSPDFGVAGVLDRFTQIQPEVLFSVNSVVYNGKVHDNLGKVASIVKGLHQLKKVIIIGYCGDEDNLDISSIPNSVTMSEFLKMGLTNDGRVPHLEFEQVTFNHPLFIMYSSGTTGPPKCMVHSVGGTLLKQLEEHVIQCNMRPQDIMIYYTTTGWMMWNWMVAALAVGSAIVLYDGSPLVPTPNVLWDLVDRIGVTVLGTGAKWLSVIEEKGLRPRETHRLATLHTILSTGSPLKPHSFDYVHTHIKPDLMLASISGGTDIMGCFMGANTSVPVHRGEIQSFHLGCAMGCWSESGCPVLDGGVPGELVCTRPFPSMPTHFWGDSDGILYAKAYFASFPGGVWAHGDYCQVNPRTGGIVMLGRSDGTLNPNGVRFGSAEIYNIVESFEEVEDSLCVAQRNREQEERVVLFIKTAKKETFTPELLKRVRDSIRAKLSARHVPGVILHTSEIPYTVSGKKVEVAVRKIIAGEEVKNISSLANPDCLKLYKDLPEVQNW